ncbi:MAG: glycosyltransferase family 4 protein [Caulobacterales bacterium]|nr:glycosyltransferase family 4 protein [Caulobacterales bacterium]
MGLEDDPGGLRGRLAILHPPGALGLGPNPFGKDVANLQLWQALARHGGYGRIDVLSLRSAEPAALSAALFDGAAATAETPRTQIGAALFPAPRVAAEAGTVLRGQPYLEDLGWMRRRSGSDRAYSLAGVVHTLAPPAIRRMIAMGAVGPLHPWDALICTSPSVRDALAAMFDGFGQHLAERTGGRPPPHPALPVIPLGVDAAAFAALADRPQARARARAALGLGEADVLVLWVGRLSYYEKAFPQPMFKAVQQAKAATGAGVVFAMAGWFPDAADRAHYEAAARAHAPGVPVHFLDGNDRAALGDLWAGADIFLSLVDNIQETFGITPLEAMAAGLPVVASDWDGYRFTMRHGQEAFLIPTLSGPVGGGVGAALVERHVAEALTYQAYVGAVAQHTAVHIGRAAEALAQLIRSPDLRARMGAAGRRRVAETFDWPVVARQIHALTDELAELRAAAAEPAHRTLDDPVRDDPFRAFAHFATDQLTLDTWLRPAPGATAAAVRAAPSVQLDGAFPGARASPELCAQAFEAIAAAGALRVRDVLAAFPVQERRRLEMGLAWMAKLGVLDWLD